MIMDPLIGSALIGGASSLVSGLFGTSSQNTNIDKQIAAQAAENQKMREYNLNLAKMQNQWNIDQWNRENEYNAPKAQMQRLAAAGLNPDLFYQNGVSGMTAASSPSMTTGAPATPQDMSALGQKKTVGQAMQEGLQGAMLGAQLDLLRSQIRKNDADAAGSEINNQTLGAMNEAELQQYADSHNLNKQQFENLKQTNLLLQQQVSLTTEQVKQARMITKNMPLRLYQENVQRNWDIIWKKYDVFRLLTDMSLTRAEIWRIKQLVPKQIELWNKELSDLSLGSAIANFLNGLVGEPGDTPLETVTKLGEALREGVSKGGAPAPLVPKAAVESPLGRKLRYDTHGFVTFGSW